METAKGKRGQPPPKSPHQFSNISKQTSQRKALDP
jgi:hypothetical protein